MTRRSVKCRTSKDGRCWSAWSAGEPICRGERVDQALSVDGVAGVTFYSYVLGEYVEYRLASHATTAKPRYAVGESGPELVQIDINVTPAAGALARFRRQVAKLDSPQARTARKARERRQWHRVAGR